jgi:hypothetical protein
MQEGSGAECAAAVQRIGGLGGKDEDFHA